MDGVAQRANLVAMASAGRWPLLLLLLLLHVAGDAQKVHLSYQKLIFYILHIGGGRRDQGLDKPTAAEGEKRCGLDGFWFYRENFILVQLGYIQDQ
jgi:hypothetical protein